MPFKAPASEEAASNVSSIVSSSAVEPTVEPDDQLLLEWTIWHDDDSGSTKYSIDLDKIDASKIDLSKKNCAEPGEWQERHYTLKLVDKKTKKELGELSFEWWKKSQYSNLMNFNQHSKAPC